ncbi:MAG: hypothetical protein AB7E81_07485 [Hyphomicrobiaceae bacterium]
MIDAVTRNKPQYIRMEQQQPRQSDGLTAKRAEESRQLALAVMNQQQRAKVQQAVAAYMSVATTSPLDQGQPGATLAQAHGAYAEF